MFPKTTANNGIGPILAADSVETFEFMAIFEEDGDEDGDDELVCLMR